MKYWHWPEGMRTVEIPYTPRNDFVTFMLEHFGRPQRNSAVQCDCERDANASVLQVLSFVNHPRVRQKIADPKGQVARILKRLGWTPQVDFEQGLAATIHWYQENTAWLERLRSGEYQRSDTM